MWYVMVSGVVFISIDFILEKRVVSSLVEGEGLNTVSSCRVPMPSNTNRGVGMVFSEYN